MTKILEPSAWAWRVDDNVIKNSRVAKSETV
ncbi:hypothetical protein MPNT_170005 [Candidatus Methylacidithermus pantelleriae]|uniref:Uncharacterized protein n=1 Tax=Candidatus Methylacidithermus pantelleriae TaxID=2744239 RepID=A0A8J2BRQ0_9BACT|nr:hypothetical protein MPNT_170005 [Candidatus Methylacidithermus pantelleriae]